MSHWLDPLEKRFRHYAIPRAVRWLVLCQAVGWLALRHGDPAAPEAGPDRVPPAAAVDEAEVDWSGGDPVSAGAGIGDWGSDPFPATDELDDETQRQLLAWLDRQVS